MAVTFEIEGGAECSFHSNAIPVLLNDGRTIPASDLANGDRFRIRGGMDAIAFATIVSEPVVT